MIKTPTRLIAWARSPCAWGRYLICVLFGLMAQLSCHAQDRFGVVYRVQGGVTASDAQTHGVRALQQGEVVFVGEVIRADVQGEAVLQVDDGGVMAVRPGTVFLVDRFIARRNRHDELVLRILRGGMRLITGLIGASEKQNYRIVTPRATVGIRGTDHEPYVITADMAKELKQPEGTYDKVNSGGTLVASDAGDVQVSPGEAGFAPLTNGASRTRALLTALMPRILDRVPDFYRPGAFDGLLADLARRSMEEAQRTGAMESPEPDTPVASAAKPSAPSTATASPAAPASARCTRIATTWLAELDGALKRRDAQSFIEKFDVNANVTVVVRTSEGREALLEFTREEMADSTLDALADLQSFSTHRPSIVVQELPSPGAVACARLHVESLTVEGGVRGGRAYQLESLESYELEFRNGKWLAIGAKTTQR